MCYNARFISYYILLCHYYFLLYFLLFLLLCHYFSYYFSYYDTLFYIIFPIIFNYDRMLASRKWQGAHLESLPPGINMYVHVWTMYVHASDNASVCTLLRHVYTNHEMYIHVYTWYVQKWKIINMYVHGMYMVCTMKATNMYVHCSDMYAHVCTFTYKVCMIQTCTYKVQTCIYMQCSVYRWLHTFHELYRQRCTVYIHRSTVYVHWYILSAAAFLFARLAGLLAGTGCCLVSHLFKFKHTSLISISLRT